MSPAEYVAYGSQSIQEAVDRLFREAAQPTDLGYRSPFTGMTRQEFRNLSSEERQELRREDVRHVGQFNVRWLQRMASSEEPALLERMTFFWHGHFACRIRSTRSAGSYLNTLRLHALGNFRDLVLGVAREPAMIRYLNNQQNRKQSPNENFARELMELFTIGRGHYTERDVKEAARAFTGWSSGVQEEFIFRPLVHDFEEKEFMGRTGPFDGDDIIDIILERRETADFIAAKVYTYFVNDRPDAERIRELGTVFYESDYDIAKLMRYLFTSDWFYAPAHRGNRIKAPVDLLAGMMRQLHLSFDQWQSVVFLQRGLGQVPFDPPNVAGWPLGKEWIDNAKLMLRLNLSTYLVLASEVDLELSTQPEATEQLAQLKRLQAHIDWEPLDRRIIEPAGADPYDQLVDFLLATPPKVSRSEIEPFVRSLHGQATQPQALVMRLMSFPEYQLS